MKKLVLKAVALSVVLFSVTQTNLKAQAVEEGTAIFDVYYGFPNLYTSVLKAAYNTEPNVSVAGSGPIGVKAEYMLTDKIGFGLEMNYTNTIAKWTDNVNGGTYNYEVSVPRFRAMGKFNFHFAKSDVFDAYTAVGAGYSSWKAKMTTNDPTYVDDTSLKNPIPIAFRLALGGRYFFTDNIGIGLEFGLGGGALINGGIAVKL